jgi:hypothetical protein
MCGPRESEHPEAEIDPIRASIPRVGEPYPRQHPAGWGWLVGGGPGCVRVPAHESGLSGSDGAQRGQLSDRRNAWATSLPEQFMLSGVAAVDLMEWARRSGGVVAHWCFEPDSKLDQHAVAG